MVSHEFRFIFVHIQKTAGKSFLHALGLPLGADHRFADVQRAAYGEEIWNTYFKFAIVRDPWDRLVSGYHYRLSGGSRSPDDLARAKLYPRSFRKFCANLDYFIGLPNEHMFRPQYQWISDADGNSLMDFVGRFEHLQEDFGVICERIGLQGVELPHINKSKHRSYWSHYARHTRDIVARAYAGDLERFGYEFGHSVPEPPRFRLFLDGLLRRQSAK
jgi:hypothetical protein